MFDQSTWSRQPAHSLLLHQVEVEWLSRGSPCSMRDMLTREKMRGTPSADAWRRMYELCHLLS